MKKLVLITALLAAPTLATADSVGGCGWGSKLFHGQRGIPVQVLAVTTNGTLGNQTFGISSGTSGCTQDGVVNSNWKTVMFIDGNKNRLAQDMSVGQGESLAALANLIGVSKSDEARFFATAQANFGTIFPNENVSATEVLSSLRGVLSQDAQLAKYSA